MTFTVALCQVASEQYEIDANRARAAAAVERAADGADLVVLPEDVLTGVGPGVRNIADADGNESTLTCEVDTAILTEAESAYQIRRDRTRYRDHNSQ
jgi:hypothetical protein